MIGTIVGLLIEGVIFGVVVRALIPGEQTWTIPQTVGVGVIGWLVLGIILKIIFGAFVALLLPVLLFGGAFLLIRGRLGRGGGGPPARRGT